MTYDHDNPEYENEIPYDSMIDDLTDEEAIAELMEEGYSEEEARRMAGDYDADEYYGFDDDSDRDIPDFIDDGDFE